MVASAVSMLPIKTLENLSCLGWDWWRNVHDCTVKEKRKEDMVVVVMSFQFTWWNYNCEQSALLVLTWVSAMSVVVLHDKFSAGDLHIWVCLTECMPELITCTPLHLLTMHCEQCSFIALQGVSTCVFAQAWVSASLSLVKVESWLLKPLLVIMTSHLGFPWVPQNKSW